MRWSFLAHSQINSNMENPISRKVGVEIECIAIPFDGKQERRLSAIAEIDGDGSIDVNDGNKDGYEIKTKPFSGERAEQAIAEACAVLKEADASVNVSCGLHVHADAAPLALTSLVTQHDGRHPLKECEQLVYIHSGYLAPHMSGFGYNEFNVALAIVDIFDDGGQMTPCVGAYGEGSLVDLRGLRRRNAVSPTDGKVVIPESRYGEFIAFAIKIEDIRSMRTRLAATMRFLAAVDPILRSMIPSSRRRNTYCKPFEKVVRSGGPVPKTVRDMYEGITERYCGVNLSALSRHGTIECRYHNGTTDADKIIHWARMWARIVDVAVSDNAELEADAMLNVVSQKSRTDMLLALLDLPEDTEKHLRARIRSFSGSDAASVKSYIQAKKPAVCVA